ncbi:glycerate kinase [Aplysia californica]|uniref:Glycerate kinase n=1 Tax=Aplysia californica TaxID=6500 RepID=A0ABM0JEN5_APLCA|nr:glycerate kinase [Aplysia californica]
MSIVQHLRMLSPFSVSGARFISTHAVHLMQQIARRKNVLPYCAVGIFKRNVSYSRSLWYETSVVEDTERQAHANLKSDAEKMFKYSIKSVHPQQMIEGVLHFNRATSVLRVQQETYHLHRNVFVVGMGKAVLGMAKAVEDVLGDHIVTGIISIPRGLQEEMIHTNNREMMLSPNTKILVYEGADNNEVDEASHNASKAILSLVNKLTEKDLLVVLCSGGGSTLCPSPPPAISLQELLTVTRLLAWNGATVQDMNTIRKNLEILKGGGLALQARPAKVVSLILSSIIGDPIDLIASGPTYPTQPTPSHCLEILQRLNLLSRTPESVRRYLEREAKQQNRTTQDKQVTMSNNGTPQVREIWKGLQNIVVGNNSIACEAAAEKAAQMGYRPVILTKFLVGEAREVGKLYARLGEYIMMCFDRKASQQPNTELTQLELELVAGGLRKQSINHIADEVDTAHNLNKDICVIASGETVVHVEGTGTGGKNQETALAAAIQMKEAFRGEECFQSETDMCVLSCDSDGYDGQSPVAGAVVDQDLVDRTLESGLSMEAYLANNDSNTFFSTVNEGQNLVWTNITGTNVMDMVILLVRKPSDRKFKWN